MKKLIGSCSGTYGKLVVLMAPDIPPPKKPKSPKHLWEINKIFEDYANTFLPEKILQVYFMTKKK